jgi:hypothetical protein
MKYRLLAALAALLLAGCDSHVPLDTAALDAQGKQFAAPAPSLAALYVSYGETRGWVPFALSLDQRSLGVLGKGTWLRVDVKPGTYDLRCAGTGEQGIPDSLPVPLVAGHIWFVRASYVIFGNPACRLTAIAPDAAKAEILTRQRIRETGGASD